MAEVAEPEGDLAWYQAELDACRREVQRLSYVPDKDGLRRVMQFEPAWDRSSPDPKKNYGVHCMNARWMLIGPLGVVQFLLHTGWQLPHIRDRLRGSSSAEYAFQAQPADLGYHWRVPTYEGQEQANYPCDFFEGGQHCYYDGSGLNAIRVFEAFTARGEDAIWGELEDYYRHLSDQTAVSPEDFARVRSDTLELRGELNERPLEDDHEGS
jgi:hypothetical protein